MSKTTKTTNKKSNIKSKASAAKVAAINFVRRTIFYMLVVVLAAFALQGVMSLIDGNETVRVIIATGFVSLLIFAVFKLSSESKA